MQGWDACGPTLQTGQTSEARRAGRKCGWRSSPSCGGGSGVRQGCSRLEPPEAAGFLPAAKRTVKHKMPSCGADDTLWTALDGQRVPDVEQPCRRPEDAAVADGRYSCGLRRSAVRPERRPRVPGGAWSEGLLCAADDSARPKPKTRSKSLAGYLTDCRSECCRAGWLVAPEGLGHRECGSAPCALPPLLSLIERALWRPQGRPEKGSYTSARRALTALTSKRFGQAALAPPTEPPGP